MSANLGRRDRKPARRAAIVAAALIVLGIAGAVLAVPVPVSGTYADGKVLTKADLDTNFTAIESRLQALEGSASVPAGTVVAFAGAIDANPGGTTAALHPPPTGWLYCNGDPVSRTQYGALFNAVGIAHGGGDGQNSFNLPDYRGLFLRGVDAMRGLDPGAMNRMKPRNGEVGVTGGWGNPGDAVGSLEANATALPSTAFTTSNAGGHSHAVGMAIDGAFTAGDLDFQTGGSRTFSVAAAGPYGLGSTSAQPDHAHSVTAGGDAETRPINSAVYYIIKT